VLQQWPVPPGTLTIGTGDSRQCYVHPEIIAAYMDGTTTHAVRALVEQEMARGLSELPPEEAAVMALLQQRLKCTEKHVASGHSHAQKC
jgi:DNA topoisomerase IB